MSKPHIEEMIEYAFKKRIEESEDTAGAIYGVIHNKIEQLQTGNWSQRYPQDDYMRREATRDEAYTFINGFIWGIYAAGIIPETVRGDMLDALMNERNNPKRDAYLRAIFAAADEEAVAPTACQPAKAVDVWSEEKADCDMVADCAPASVSCEICPHNCDEVAAGDESEGGDNE